MYGFGYLLEKKYGNVVIILFYFDFLIFCILVILIVKKIIEFAPPKIPNNFPLKIRPHAHKIPLKLKKNSSV